jgi:hypothetical protein
MSEIDRPQDDARSTGAKAIKVWNLGDMTDEELDDLADALVAGMQLGNVGDEY